jgi:hypothetical protein
LHKSEKAGNSLKIGFDRNALIAAEEMHYLLRHHRFVLRVNYLFV